MQVRAITVWQPHAAAIFLGKRDVESRSYAVEPGRLYIHTGTNHLGALELRRVKTRVNQTVPMSPATREAWAQLLAVRGALIGHVDVVQCGKNISSSVWAEPDTIHWVLRSPVLLARPIPMRGRQKLFLINTEDCALGAA